MGATLEDNQETASAEVYRPEVITFSNSGTLPIGNVPLQCFVGTNSKSEVVRVISGRSLTSAIGMKGRGAGVKKRIAEHNKLRPFMSPELVRSIEQPLVIQGGPGPTGIKPAEGYEATVLLELCQAILDARAAGVLKTEAELRYASYSEVLIRSMAKVGIIALVDEATGYQAQRAREELQQLLEKFVAKELRPWVKTFPDDYYEQLFRLKKWQYKPLSVKRPKVVGRITNEIIYARMPTGVLEELKKRTPKTDRGNRSHKYHQSLTGDLGLPMLQQMLAGVTALMRASTTWTGFLHLLERAYPPKKERQQQLSLWEESEEEEVDSEA